MDPFQTLDGVMYDYTTVIEGPVEKAHVLTDEIPEKLRVAPG
jgi:hypothetical protein